MKGVFIRTGIAGYGSSGATLPLHSAASVTATVGGCGELVPEPTWALSTNVILWRRGKPEKLLVRNSWWLKTVFLDIAVRQTRAQMSEHYWRILQRQAAWTLVSAANQAVSRTGRV